MLLDGVVDAIKAASVGGAVEVLVTVAKGKRMPASARVAAASRILEFNFRSHELVTIEKRLAQLEEIARGKP